MEGVHPACPLKGSCLCGGIAFEIHGEVAGVARCHCSLCRKLSGTNATATVFVTAEQLVWLKGKEQIQDYQRPSGYGTSFYRVCGSPAPDGNRARTRYGMPAGLLEGDPSLRVIEHIFVGSKAS